MDFILLLPIGLYGLYTFLHRPVWTCIFLSIVARIIEKNEKKINKPQISRYDFQKRIEEYYYYC